MGISRTLAVLPHRRSSDAIEWEVINHVIAQGEVIELCIQTDYERSTWTYLGRYQCLFSTKAPPKALWSAMSSVRLADIIRCHLCYSPHDTSDTTMFSVTEPTETSCQFDL